MTYNDKLEAIFDKHGYQEQLSKLSEEASEFTRAVTEYQYDLHDKQPTVKALEKRHVEEEFADVLVVLMQFRGKLDLDWDIIRNTMRFKVDRQCERDNIC